MPISSARLTPAERTLRATALTLAESGRQREGRANGAVHPAEPATGGVVVASGPEEHAAPLRMKPLTAFAPAPAARRDEPPVITITIAGAPHSGKSVISHLIRAALARKGVATSGPAKLRSVLPRQALADLIWRGLSVELVKIERGAE